MEDINLFSFPVTSLISAPLFLGPPDLLIQFTTGKQRRSLDMRPIHHRANIPEIFINVLYVSLLSKYKSFLLIYPRTCVTKIEKRNNSSCWRFL